MRPREIEDFLYANNSGIKDNLTTDSPATKGNSRIKRTRIDLNQLGNLKPGDQITWKRTYGIWHDAVVEEVNAKNKTLKVIHLSTLGSERIVHRKTVEVEKENGQLYRKDYTRNERLSPEETLKIARGWTDKQFRHKSYNLLTNNCEHFATYCTTGNCQSYQTKDAVEKVGIGFGEAIFMSTPHVIKAVKTRANKFKDKPTRNTHNETKRSTDSQQVKQSKLPTKKIPNTKKNVDSNDASSLWRSSSDSHYSSSRFKKNNASKGSSKSWSHSNIWRDFSSLSTLNSDSNGTSANSSSSSDLADLKSMSLRNDVAKVTSHSSSHSNDLRDFSSRFKTNDDSEYKSSPSSYSSDSSMAEQGKGPAALIVPVCGTGGVALAVKKAAQSVPKGRGSIGGIVSVVKETVKSVGNARGRVGGIALPFKNKISQRVAEARDCMKVGWKPTVGATAFAACVETVSSIYDIRKLYQSKKKGDISKSDFIESTTQRVVEGTFAVGGSTICGALGSFLGSLICPGIGTVIGSLVGSTLGNFVSRFVGKIAGSKIGKFFSKLFS